MTEQQIRDEFSELIISLIHGLPYEEAIKKELRTNCKIVDNEGVSWLLAKASPGGQYWITSDEIDDHKGVMRLDHRRTDYEIIGLPITIGRVMQALQIICDRVHFQDSIDGFFYIEVYRIHESPLRIGWKLTKENGLECTADDQDIETIKKLILLLKK